MMYTSTSHCLWISTRLPNTDSFVRVEVWDECPYGNDMEGGVDEFIQRGGPFERPPVERIFPGYLFSLRGFCPSDKYLEWMFNKYLMGGYSLLPHPFIMNLGDALLRYARNNRIEPKDLRVEFGIVYL